MMIVEVKIAEGQDQEVKILDQEAGPLSHTLILRQLIVSFGQTLEAYQQNIYVSCKLIDRSQTCQLPKFVSFI